MTTEREALADELWLQVARYGLDVSATRVLAPHSNLVKAFEAVRAALSASQPPDVPPGWKLGPIKPTAEMLKVGGHVNSEWLNDKAPLGEIRYALPLPGVYEAMLAAAPTPTGEV